MSKKDYIKIANAIKQAHEKTGKGESIPLQAILATLSQMFKNENPRFMESRFCGYVRGECGPCGGAVS